MHKNPNIPVLCLVLLALLILSIHVTAQTNSTTNTNTFSITSSVSPSSPRVGDTVTISGIAQGGNLTPGVKLWIFAGNYANITVLPVNSSGYYSRSIDTTGLPPAYYYIFAQHPGTDSSFDITSQGFSGQVMNTKTGEVIFNFTGNGSVNDNNAAIALSNAFNTKGVDDVFSKTGVELRPLQSTTTVPPAKETAVATSAGTPITVAPGTTRAVLPVWLAAMALVIAGMIVIRKKA